MRFLWVLLLYPLAALPQDGARVSGVLLERDAPAVSGEFSIRTPDNQVFRYRFDPQTRVDRDGFTLVVALLHPGDKVDVVSDRLPHADLRYALAVYVTLSAAPHPAPPPRDSAFEDRPVGDLSFSGTISQLSGARVVLQMRSGARQSIVLLKSTRYFDTGEIVDAAALKPNMRVFVQAGKSLYGEVEAYQVIWGQILQPK